MSTKITYSEYFDFSDATPLKKGISGIEEVEASHKKAIDSLVKDNKRLAKSNDELIKQAQAIKADVNASSEAHEKGRAALDKNLKATNALVVSVKKNSAAQKDNVKSIKTLSDHVLKIKKAKESLIRTEKQETSLKSKLLDLQGRQSKSNALVRLRIQEKNKALKEEAMSTLGLLSPYQKQSKRLNDLRNRYKDLVVTEKDNTKEARRLKNEIQSLDTTLKRADANVGQFQRNVGNYGKAWASVGNVLRSAGLIGGIAGVVSVIKNSVKTFAQFEQSVSQLSSITGAVGQDLQFYREQAIQMGATTTKSATEVVTAFKLVGSARPELLKNKEALASVTKEAITLAEAAGIDVPEAAKALASGLNQFKLPARDAGRIINVLAAGSKEGAAAIPEVTEAIDKFGSIARTAGISIEGSVAAVEALAPAGLVGAEAGTKLRNVLIELQNGADDINPSIVGFDQALENLGNQNLSVTELTKKFGKQNVLAAKTLIEERKEVARLTVALTGTTTAYDQASTNVDNLKGDVAALSSAWEGLILGIEDGSGVFNVFLRGITQAATKLLNMLSGVEKSFESSVEGSTKLAKGNLELANSSQILLDEYESLKKDGIEPTQEESERLTEIEILLTSKLGDSVRVINEQTGAFELNTEAVRNQIKQKRLSFDVEATQLASRLEGEKQAIKLVNARIKREELDVQAARRIAEERGVLTAEINRKTGSIIRLFGKEKEARDLLLNSEMKLIKSKSELEDRLEKEQILIAALADLNFSEADAEALLADAIDETTDSLDENTKSTKENLKAKKAAERLARRISEASFELEKFRLEQLILLNQNIIEDEEMTLNARLNANKNATDQRVKLALLEKEFLLKNSKLLADEQTLILEEFNAKAKEIALDSASSLTDLLGSNDNSIDIDSILNERLTKNEIALNEELQKLNEQLSNKEISVVEFEKRRLEAQTSFNATQIDNELAFLENSLQIFAETEEEKLAIQKRISELRLKASEDLNTGLINNERELQNAVQDLKQTAFDAAGEIVNNSLERGNEQREVEIENLQKEKETKLQIVGDDKQAQAFIEEEFARKTELIKQQQAKADRKRAKADKKLAITQSIISTITASVKALPNIPLSILIGIIGAGKTALIAAQQIPGLFVGTKDHVGGLADVHEKGAEIIATPDGKVSYNKNAKPSRIDLPKHSIVIPAKESKDIYDQAKSINANFPLEQMIRSSESVIVRESQRDDGRILQGLETSSNRIVSAIKKGNQDVWDDKGYRRYNNTANGRVLSLNKRNKLGSEG